LGLGFLLRSFPLKKFDWLLCCRSYDNKFFVIQAPLLYPLVLFIRSLLDQGIEESLKMKGRPMPQTVFKVGVVLGASFLVGYFAPEPFNPFIVNNDEWKEQINEFNRLKQEARARRGY